MPFLISKTKSKDIFSATIITLFGLINLQIAY